MIVCLLSALIIFCIAQTLAYITKCCQIHEMPEATTALVKKAVSHVKEMLRAYEMIILLDALEEAVDGSGHSHGFRRRDKVQAL